MSRETENALLLLVGLSTAIVTITGTFTRYVRPSLLPWLAAVSVLLIALAVNAMFIERRRARTPVKGDHEHPHRPGLSWLLMVPVVVMAFVVPPALGAHAAISQRAVALSVRELRQPFPPLPDGRAPEVSLKEVLKRVVNDSAGTLNDRLITVTGFALHGPTGVDLARFAIFCCAADAQLARIHLRGPQAAEAGPYPDNTWLRVEGRVVPLPPDRASSFIPDVMVTTVTRVEAPDNPYAY